MTEIARRQLAATHLIDFARYTFPGYRAARHLYKLAAALERVASGETRRLMVTMPPRHGKSEMVSVRFPAWYLGRNPDRRIILASYAADLAQRFSRQVRQVVTGEAFGAVFPAVSLATDTRSVEAWDLALPARGGMKSVGVGGPITGFGAHLLLIDDPVKNREEADSEVTRQSVWDWYTSTAYTRLEEQAAVVVVMTRWHEDDLAGRLLAAQDLDPRADRWEVLHMPALSEDGAALWPGKYDAEELARIRANVGPRDWEALYQGRPRPAEGATFRREWFRVVDHAPAGLRWVRYWDLAASTKTLADYTASAACALGDDGTLYVRDVIRGRWEWPDAQRVIVQTALAEPEVTVGIEKAGFQLAAVQSVRRDRSMVGVTVREVEVDRDKLSRALPWAARAEAGKLALVRGAWVQEFVGECLSFPVGAHDDQVDAVSGCVQMIARGRKLEVH